MTATPPESAIRAGAALGRRAIRGQHRRDCAACRFDAKRGSGTRRHTLAAAGDPRLFRDRSRRICEACEGSDMTGDSRNAALENAIMPRIRDLGDGFEVRRALPSAQRRMVGPFVFFDQMGPVVLGEGRGLDVRPHPHIGLATVTYLLDGEILHRDSVGSVQPIRPGEVNWMTAGSGIVHSERTRPELRASGSSLFGLQTWVALPKAYEEIDPSFS